MAVTPMKLATIVGPLAEFDNVVLECVINHEFHPEPASGVARRVKLLYPFDLNNPYDGLLRQSESVAEHLSLKLDYCDYSGVDRDLDNLRDYLTSLDKRFTAMAERKQELLKSIEEGAQILAQLNHLIGVNVDLSDFFNLKYVKFRFGYLPRDSYDNFMPRINERDDVFFIPTLIEKNTVYGIYMMSRVNTEKIDALLASVQFVRVRISERVHGSGTEAVEYIKEETEESEKSLAELNEAMEALIESERDRFLSAYSFIRLMNDSYNIRRFAAHTRDSFYLLGWVPGESLAGFTGNVSKVSPDSVVVADDPGNIEDYTPPVKLKNNVIFSAYEPYVSVYGLPSYNEMDPTPFMAVTYTLLFGIMFGDVGQGAVLALAGFMLWKLKGFWLGRVGCYMGISSVMFGFVYGSVFGSEHLLPGFKVLEGAGSRSILQYSIYLSLIVIAVVMIFNICNGIRQKDRVKVIFGSNGLAGLIFYFAFMGLALPFIGFGEQIFPQKLLAAVLIVPALLIFFREPLAKLIGRRKDWLPEKAGTFITENVFELIEVVLSYMTNTISFLRVGAYAISHASMMTVVYMLAQTAKGGHNIAVLIIGNIFIMCLEALLAGIQVLRLEFYEMFSRFYSGNGRPYAPVIIDYKRKND